MEVPKDQITTLLEHNLFGSAQMLGCFLVSSATTNVETSPYVKAENLVLLGDALYGEKEFRRALNTYKQALQHCKIIPKQSMTSSRSSLSTSNRSSSPNSLNISAINENEVKFKITLCYCALNENRPALAEMEGIPSKARTLQMNLTMGKLYRISRHFRAAISCYKDCLRHCPYVLEAIIALAELGVPAKDIISLFPQTLNRIGRPPSDHFDTGRWLQRYVEAQCCVASNDYKGGLELFSELLQRFPSNVHILLEIAKVEAIIGRSDGAIMNFEKARSIDPYIITYMDEYAMLLKTKSDHSKLNRLVHDLLNIDPARAEVLVALSVLWEKKDDRRALVFAEKSIRIDDRHITGHIMKGYLFLSQNRPEAAVAAFRAAQELRSDLRSYQGLVRSYLALSKTKEALYAAREAMRAMPQSAKALKLVGDVHASNSGGREKARKFYESALRLESGYLGAALALAELHVKEGRTGDAIALLERYLKDWADDSLHIKLAQVFAATNMLSEALSHYQSALRLNSQNEAAKKGLERLEKQMKGMDPDAPEEDDENEVEDAEGEQEEAELLFTYKFIQYRNKAVYDIMGYCVCTAKGAAETLKFNMALILLPVCRNTITWLRNKTKLGMAVPFDDNLNFHKVIAVGIAIGVGLHAGAHLTCDFPRLLHATPKEYEPMKPYFGHKQPPNYWWFVKGVEGVTGIVMVVLMAIAFTLATPWFRRNKLKLPQSIKKLTGFNAFWYSHHLFVIVYVLLIIHGIFLYLSKEWYKKTTWMYIAIPVILYASERLIRVFRSGIKPVKILKVAVYPGNVLALHMSKPQGFKYKSGQYMFVNCAAVSPFEWHPFSITSAPRDDYLSVHIRTLGDWTRQLKTVFSEVCKAPTGGKSGLLRADHMQGGNSPHFPRVLIDGPYGAPAQDYKQYEVVLLVGLGIGATPFISIVKDIVNNMKAREEEEEELERGNSKPNNARKSGFKTRRAYFYWVTREQGSFDWFKTCTMLY